MRSLSVMKVNNYERKKAIFVFGMYVNANDFVSTIVGFSSQQQC